MCWMLTVDMTSMPAASMASTSCQRFALREPGALVWASSSTSASCGARREHGIQVELVEVTPRCSIVARGMTSSPSSIAAVAARPCVSTTATTTSLPSALQAPALFEHRVRLARRRVRRRASPAGGHEACVRPLLSVQTRRVRRRSGAGGSESSSGVPTSPLRPRCPASRRSPRTASAAAPRMPALLRCTAGTIGVLRSGAAGTPGSSSTLRRRR